jgi:hypothetical protein
MLTAMLSYRLIPENALTGEADFITVAVRKQI